MPVSKNMKRTMGTFSTAAPEPAAVTRKSRSKAPGTRVGVLLDWREGDRRADGCKCVFTRKRRSGAVAETDLNAVLCGSSQIAGGIGHEAHCIP